jgi:hypothetical protein
VEPPHRPPAGHGIRDADLLDVDADTSWDAEDAVIRRGARVYESKARRWKQLWLELPVRPWDGGAQA